MFLLNGGINWIFKLLAFEEQVKNSEYQFMWESISVIVIY